MKINYGIQMTKELMREKKLKRQEVKNFSMNIGGNAIDHVQIRNKVAALHPGWTLMGYAPANVKEPTPIRVRQYYEPMKED